VVPPTRETPSPLQSQAPPPPPPVDPAAAAGATGPGTPAVGLPIVAGLPLELWLVVAAFALPGAWLVYEVVKALPDAIKYLGSQYFGFRLGLALVLLLLVIGALGVAMVAIAWRLYRRDRVGRGLAYAFGGTIIVSVLLASDRTSAETWAMVFSIVGIAILAFAPRVRAIFDASAPGAAPTSVVVSRTLIAIFSGVTLLIGAVYLLLSSDSGKYAVAGVIAIAAAILASRWSRRLDAADKQARLYLSLGGAVVGVLLIALGEKDVGLLVPLGMIVSAIGCLWLPNDARAFFGDQPIRVSGPAG
jgi:hypothetical protein